MAPQVTYEEAPQATADKDLLDYIQENWTALRTVALNSPPDCVLVTWMTPGNTVIHALPREKVIEQDPDSVPALAKEGPRSLSPGAEASVWVAVCRRLDDGDDNFTVFWCAVDFNAPVAKTTH